MHILNKAVAKYIYPILLTTVSMSLLSGCVTQSFENDEPIVKNQANRDEMAATRVSLGLGYLGMGDMSQAKLNLEKAKKFSPNLVQVHTAFAHYYETVGESALAIESFEQALSIKADSADTLNNYGVFLCRQGNVEAAEKQFLKAIAVPSYLLVSQSYENLASCYLQNDDFEKSEMYLNKAIHHSPNRSSTLLQMVRLQYAMADYKEAKRFLQKFERSTQRFTADSLALAYKLYWKLGQRRTAGNYANMLVKMYPQSWEGKQYLLNELALIDADNLAKKYQLTQKQKNRELTPDSNKRVVKLSPRKDDNSPYTGSVKTYVSPKETGSKVADVSKSSSALSSSVAATPSVVSTATQATLSTGGALLTATAAGAGAIVATNAVTSSTKAASIPTAASEPIVTSVPATTSAVSVNNVAAKEEVIALGAAAIDAQAITDEATSALEPTSTQPVPATRDVPLPEALPEEVVAEVVPAKIVTPEPALTSESANVAESVTGSVIASEAVNETLNETELVSKEDALHTVTPGENLYNISMKYNVKLNTLRKWNDISEKNNIRIGDKLYVVDPKTVNNN